MKFIELFAGIGGFRLGLERTGHECVFSNEWLEKPRRIYKNNFGEEPDGRDIKLIQGGELPEADLIVGGFLVQLLVLLEKEQDLTSLTPEVHYASRCLGSHSKGEYLILCLRMSRDSSIMTMEELSQSSSQHWMRWGMTVNGNCWTANTSVSHNGEKGFSLSQILEENPDQKYFLSDKQKERICRIADLKKTRLQEPLKQVCERESEIQKEESSQGLLKIVDKE